MNFYEPIYYNQWCHEKKLDYLPVVFPGFSWHNLKGAELGAIPRLKGQFLWSQIAGWLLIWFISTRLHPSQREFHQVKTHGGTLFGTPSFVLWSVARKG